MRAAWYDDFGPAADVLETGKRPDPVPGGGEVLVRLHASAINPSDVKKRAGAFPELLDDGYIIPNSDGAGVIESVGVGVDSSRVGQKVWVYQAQHRRRFGTAAEYVAIDSQRAPRLGDDIDFETGAGLGIPVMTAHRCVFADGDVKDETLLITGGAGRVGHYAIQWASQAGATVIATASNDDDAEACRDAGASHVVNHRDDDLAAQVIAANKGASVDRVIDVDFGANVRTSAKVLRIGGKISTYASMQEPYPRIPFYEMMYKDITIRTVIVYGMPESAKDHAIADIERALSKGRLKHRTAATMPLNDIVRGNELVESGNARGAVILTI
ncbi:MAG: NADPH:quinone reductase [Woeseiaceae bacterium]|nr:NADPH:quinone reductase [Woeseiaceae bacterium]